VTHSRTKRGPMRTDWLCTRALVVAAMFGLDATACDATTYFRVKNESSTPVVIRWYPDKTAAEGGEFDQEAFLRPSESAKTRFYVSNAGMPCGKDARDDMRRYYSGGIDVVTVAGQHVHIDADTIGKDAVNAPDTAFELVISNAMLAGGKAGPPPSLSRFTIEPAKAASDSSLSDAGQDAGAARPAVSHR
jgi:hypothetical protein